MKKKVQLNDIRAKIRSAIETKYGGVTEFLSSPAGKKCGGIKIRPYLYDKGAVNVKVITTLCKFLGIGKLTREIEVERKISYFIEENETE